MTDDPTFFKKNTNLKQPYCFIRVHRRVEILWILKGQNYFTWLSSKRSPLLYQRLARGEKLREVSVSSFFELIDNYTVAVTYWWIYVVQKATWLGVTQSSCCRRIRALPRWMIQMFFMQCNKRCSRTFVKVLQLCLLLTDRQKCPTENSRQHWCIYQGEKI